MKTKLQSNILSLLVISIHSKYKNWLFKSLVQLLVSATITIYCLVLMKKKKNETHEAKMFQETKSSAVETENMIRSHKMQETRGSNDTWTHFNCSNGTLDSEFAQLRNS